MTLPPPRPDEASDAPELAEYLDAFGARFFAATAAETPERGETARAAGPSRTPRLRRRRWVAGAGLAVATLTILVVLLLPSGRVDIVKEASAALGVRGEILHYRSAGCGGSFQGHREAAPADCGYRGDATEVWQTTSGRPRWRMVTPAIEAGGGRMTASDGQRILGPQIFGLDGDTSTAYWPRIDRLDITTDLPPDYPRYPGLLAGGGDGDADVIATLRAKLAAGALTVVRHTEERGREVVLLTGRTRTTSGNGKPPSGTINESTLRYLVDAKTFAPVRLTTSTSTTYFKGNGRPSGGTFESSYTTVFPLFERLPLDATTERLLEIVPVRPPTKTVRRSAAQREAQERLRMRRENAEGHANALRTQAEQRAKAKADGGP